MPHRLYLIFFVVSFRNIFFLNGNSENSLHWINEILNSSFADQRMAYSCKHTLLNLMVHLGT